MPLPLLLQKTVLMALIRKLLAMRFIRFAMVGAGGFVVDATVLMVILFFIGDHPYIGRVCSILVAMTFTWLLNRSFTFAQPTKPSGKEWLKYITVNGAGAAINYGTYALGIAQLPIDNLKLKAILALMIASLTAMLFNFFGMKRLVFSASNSKEQLEK